MPVRHELLQLLGDGRRDRAAGEDREPQAGQPAGAQQPGPQAGGDVGGRGEQHGDRLGVQGAGQIRRREGGQQDRRRPHR